MIPPTTYAPWMAAVGISSEPCRSVVVKCNACGHRNHLVRVCAGPEVIGLVCHECELPIHAEYEPS